MNQQDQELGDIRLLWKRVEARRRREARRFHALVIGTSVVGGGLVIAIRLLLEWL